MSWFWNNKKWKPKIARTISGEKLKLTLQLLCPGAEIICLDRLYQIPRDPSDVTWKCSPTDLFYNEESRDCDDFVRIARGWLSRENLGNLLVMDCVVTYPGGRHAVLAFLHKDKIVFGEPQSGRIRVFKDAKIVRLIA